MHPFLSMHYKNLGMQESKKPSDDEMIELLVFNKEDIEKNKIDFRWIHEREFKYKGEMYDIVKKDEINNQLFLYCINDVKEKMLEEEFAKKIHDNSKNSKRQQIANHLNIVLSEPAQEEKINFAHFYELSFNSFYPDNYNSFQQDIPSPPPRIS